MHIRQFDSQLTISLTALLSVVLKISNTAAGLMTFQPKNISVALVASLGLF